MPYVPTRRCRAPAAAGAGSGPTCSRPPCPHGSSPSTASPSRSRSCSPRSAGLGRVARPWPSRSSHDATVAAPARGSDRRRRPRAAGAAGGRDGAIDAAGSAGRCRAAVGPPSTDRGVATMPRSCSLDWCDRPHSALGYRHTHYVRHRRGLPLEPPIKPHPQRRKPRTTRYTDRRGYIRVYRPEHPNAVGLGWVYEHVLVMSQLLGRPLFPDEQVHHRNGQRDDNRAGNLELWTTLRQPTGQRVEDLVRWALTILERYEPWRLR